MEDIYTPISCSFYDRLEEAATLGKEVVLRYKLDNEVIELVCRVITILLEDKIEWLILENDKKIRLDYIESIDGNMLAKHC